MTSNDIFKVKLYKPAGLQQHSSSRSAMDSQTRFDQLWSLASPRAKLLISKSSLTASPSEPAGNVASESHFKKGVVTTSPQKDLKDRREPGQESQASSTSSFLWSLTMNTGLHSSFDRDNTLVNGPREHVSTVPNSPVNRMDISDIVPETPQGFTTQDQAPTEGDSPADENDQSNQERETEPPEDESWMPGVKATTAAVKRYAFTDWTIKLVKTKSQQGIIVEGQREEDPPDDFWHSTIIVRRVTSRCVETRTGSQYILDGPMNQSRVLGEGLPKSFVEAFRNGFPTDWMVHVAEHFDPISRTQDGGDDGTPTSFVKRGKSSRSTSKTPKQPSNKSRSAKPRVSTPKEQMKVPQEVELKRASSGRVIKPPLAWWRGQRIVTDLGNNLVTILPGSADGTPLSRMTNHCNLKLPPGQESEADSFQQTLRSRKVRSDASGKRRSKQETESETGGSDDVGEPTEVSKERSHDSIQKNVRSGKAKPDETKNRRSNQITQSDTEGSDAAVAPREVSKERSNSSIQKTLRSRKGEPDATKSRRSNEMTESDTEGSEVAVESTEVSLKRSHNSVQGKLRSRKGKSDSKNRRSIQITESDTEGSDAVVASSEVSKGHSSNSIQKTLRSRKGKFDASKNRRSNEITESDMEGSDAAVDSTKVSLKRSNNSVHGKLRSRKAKPDATKNRRSNKITESDTQGSVAFVEFTEICKKRSNSSIQKTLRSRKSKSDATKNGRYNKKTESDTEGSVAVVASSEVSKERSNNSIQKTLRSRKGEPDTTKNRRYNQITESDTEGSDAVVASSEVSKERSNSSIQKTLRSRKGEPDTTKNPRRYNQITESDREGSDAVVASSEVSEERSNSSIQKTLRSRKSKPDTTKNRRYNQITESDTEGSDAVVASSEVSKERSNSSIQKTLRSRKSKPDTAKNRHYNQITESDTEGSDAVVASSEVSKERSNSSIQKTLRSRKSKPDTAKNRHYNQITESDTEGSDAVVASSEVSKERSNSSIQKTLRSRKSKPVATKNRRYNHITESDTEGSDAAVEFTEVSMERSNSSIQKALRSRKLGKSDATKNRRSNQITESDTEISDAAVASSGVHSKERSNSSIEKTLRSREDKSGAKAPGNASELSDYEFPNRSNRRPRTLTQEPSANSRKNRRGVAERRSNDNTNDSQASDTPDSSTNVTSIPNRSDKKPRTLTQEPSSSRKNRRGVAERRSNDNTNDSQASASPESSTSVTRKRKAAAMKRALASTHGSTVGDDHNKLEEPQKRSNAIKGSAAKTGPGKRGGIRANVAWKDFDSDAWTEGEMEGLDRAMGTIPPTTPMFWQKVSRVVRSRTAEECQLKHQAQLNLAIKKKPSRNQNKAAPAKDKPRVDKLKPLSGGVGTIKRKRELRQLLEEQDEGYEDDIFDATPFKKTKQFRVPISMLDSDDVNDIGQDDDGPFGPAGRTLKTPSSRTPSNRCRPLGPASGSDTPGNEFISPSLLHDVSIKDLDHYVYKMQQGRRAANQQRRQQKQKDAQNARTSTPKKLLAPRGRAPAPVPSGMFDVQAVAPEDDSEEGQDDYWSEEDM